MGRFEYLILLSTVLGAVRGAADGSQPRGVGPECM